MQSPNFVFLSYLFVLPSIIGTVSCLIQKDLFVDIKYDVQLKLDPIHTNAQNTVEMYSKHGQRFMCFLPSESRHMNDIPSPPINDSLVADMLAPLNRSTCLIYKHGWWTYELCYGRYVLQFHADEHGQSSETLLGFFESETKWTEPHNETDENQLFHSQFYLNGSYCDLTLSYRRVEVRYTCVPGDSFRITQVEERETCVYRMYVSAPTLCKHPSFMPAHTPRVELIQCSPKVSTTSPSKDTEHADQLASTGFPNRPTNRSLSMNFKRVHTISTILKKMQIRRRYSDRRFIRSLLKQFLRSITNPVLRETQLNSLDAFGIYLEDARDPFAPTLSRSWALYRSYLRRCLDELLNSLRQLTDSIVHISMLYSRGSPLHSKSLSAMYLVGTLTCSFIDAQLQYFEHPNKKPVYYPFEMVSDIAVLFSKLSSILLRSMSPSLADDIRFDLDMLLARHNQSNSTDGVELVGTELDNTTVSLRLRGIHDEHPAWTVSPMEIGILRYLRFRLRKTLLALKSTDQLIRLKEYTKKMGMDLETTMENLLAAATDYKILVVQSATRGASPTEDAADDRSTSQSETASEPITQYLLEVVKNVLKKLSPTASHELTVYETAASSKGTSMFVIMSSKEKSKEERRMAEMESAYNFKNSQPTEPNQLE